MSVRTLKPATMGLCTVLALGLLAAPLSAQTAEELAQARQAAAAGLVPQHLISAERIVALVRFGADSVTLEPLVAFERGHLTVSGRKGIILDSSLEPGHVYTYDLVDRKGRLLEDGTYTYDLVLTLSSTGQASEAGEEAKKAQLRRTGRFRVQGGVVRQRPSYSLPNGDAAAGRPVTPQAYDHTGNFEIDGKLLVGLEEGTPPPFDDIHIRAVSEDGDGFAGIYFENYESSTLTGDEWQLTAAPDWFGIGQTVIGLGSNGVFRIEASAPASSLYIKSDGAVGVGTGTPTAPLHVSRSNGTAQVLVEETAAGEHFLFALSNPGKTRFQINNTTAGAWTFDVDNAARFTISRLGTGANEFIVDSSGNGTFRGNVVANGVLLTSSWQTKKAIEPLDEKELLAKLMEMPVSKWQFKQDNSDTRHIGPMAEDFHEVFGLGDGRHLSMTDVQGIALAAIQGLNTKLEQEHAALRTRLETENAALRARLAELEALVGTLVATE